MRVQAAPPEHFDWLVSRTQCVLTDRARAIEAVDDAGRIRGMVAYDGWTENAAQAHMAVDAPIIWRHLLGPAFAYPFQEAGKGVLLGIIPSHNRKSVAMVKALGFREAHRVADGWAKGDDLVVFEMRRENCRFLKGVQHG